MPADNQIFSAHMVGADNPPSLTFMFGSTLDRDKFVDRLIEAGVLTTIKQEPTN